MEKYFKEMKEIKEFDLQVVHNQTEFDRIPKNYNWEESCRCIYIMDTTEIIKINDTGDCYVIALKDSIIDLFGNSCIAAYENSMIRAMDNSVIYAHDKSIIIAKDKSVIKADDMSVILAMEDDLDIQATDQVNIILYNKNKSPYPILGRIFGVEKDEYKEFII